MTNTNNDDAIDKSNMVEPSISLEGIYYETNPEQTEMSGRGIYNRKSIQNQLLENISASACPPLSQNLLYENEIFLKFACKADNGECVAATSPLWDELNSVILNIYPDFYRKINILYQERPKFTEYHTLMLIKCGFRVTQIACLQHTTKSTIVYRRSKLSISMFDIKLPGKTFDRLIRLLS